MCYGMHCPNENTLGECRTGGRRCPMDEETYTVSYFIHVDLVRCAEEPDLERVWLEGAEYGNELHCFYDRDAGIADDGHDVQISEEDGYSGKLMAYWANGYRDAMTEWPDRPEWARTWGVEE